ncbi:hypothetical protein ACFL3A_11695 [Pseudomonadota bacterium]
MPVVDQAADKNIPIPEMPIWRPISFQNLFFVVIATSYSNPISVTLSKASLINDDNVRVFNGLS